jgi:hypothetical protein
MPYRWPCDIVTFQLPSNLSISLKSVNQFTKMKQMITFSRAGNFLLWQSKEQHWCIVSKIVFGGVCSSRGWWTSFNIRAFFNYITTGGFTTLACEVALVGPLLAPVLKQLGPFLSLIKRLNLVQKAGPACCSYSLPFLTFCLIYVCTEWS